MSPNNLNPNEHDPTWTWTGQLAEWEHKSAGGVEFLQKWDTPYTVNVFVGTGDQLGGRYIKEFCETAVPINNTQKHPPGLCVTYTYTTFAHKDDVEEGLQVSLRNYPRFPKSKSQILDLAIRLAEYLIEKLEQNTALIDAPDATVWVRRKVKLEDSKSAG